MLTFNIKEESLTIKTDKIDNETEQHIIERLEELELSFTNISGVKMNIYATQQKLYDFLFNLSYDYDITLV